MITIACIVEGHGEREAVPVLIRRIAQAVAPEIPVVVRPPIRTPKGRLLKAGELERAVDLAARYTQPSGAVVVVVDADDDCPAELGPALLNRAQSARSDVPLSVIVANREFEAWFLAAARSLRGVRGLANDFEPPPDPEGVRGAKERLRGLRGWRYSETIDQPALTQAMDLEAARNSRSFDRCYREIERLIHETARLGA